MGSRGDRKYPRFDTETRAKVRILGAPEWTEVAMINLSKGGACLQSPVVFSQGSVVEIFIGSVNPDARNHSFIARVCWCTDGKFGIQFITRV